MLVPKRKLPAKVASVPNTTMLCAAGDCEGVLVVGPVGDLLGR